MSLWSLLCTCMNFDNLVTSLTASRCQLPCSCMLNQYRERSVLTLTPLLTLPQINQCMENAVHQTKPNQWIILSFQYSFGADPVTSLLDPLEEELLKTTHTYCGKSHTLLTKKLAHSLANVNRKAPRGRWQNQITIMGRGPRRSFDLSLISLVRKTRLWLAVQTACPWARN